MDYGYFLPSFFPIWHFWYIDIFKNISLYKKIMFKKLAAIRLKMAWKYNYQPGIFYSAVEILAQLCHNNN